MKMKKKMIYVFVFCFLFVSSYASQIINFRKPHCNLYYIDTIHKHMLRNQKSSNSIAIQNILSRYSRHSGQSVGKIKACIQPNK